MLEPIENQYLLIGHINRSHGVHGEVLIISEVQAPDLFDDINMVHLQNARGDLVPARIESVRAEEKNNRLSFFVQFEHVTDRTEAEEIKNSPVYVDRQKAEPLIDRPESPVDYSTYKVVDEQGQHVGEVTGTIPNPAHPILQVAAGEKQELLIPFVEEYIHSTDEDQKTIFCHNLEQLEGL